jgi:hypothetical protein
MEKAMIADRFDVFDITGCPLDIEEGPGPDAVEIAHAVSLQTASELSGLAVKLIVDHTAIYGEIAVSNFSQEGVQELLVRKTHDDT